MTTPMLKILKVAALFAPALALADDGLSEGVKALLQRSPFGASSPIQAVVAENTGGFQLRSVYCVDKRWYFGIFDATQKKFYTMQLGKTYSDEAPYVVDFYDDETNSISFSTPLGTYTLTLKERDPLTGKPPAAAAAAAAKTQARPAAAAQQQARAQQQGARAGANR